MKMSMNLFGLMKVGTVSIPEKTKVASKESWECSRRKKKNQTCYIDLISHFALNCLLSPILLLFQQPAVKHNFTGLTFSLPVYKINKR